MPKYKIKLGNDVVDTIDSPRPITSSALQDYVMNNHQIKQKLGGRQIVGINIPDKPDNQGNFEIVANCDAQPGTVQPELPLPSGQAPIPPRPIVPEGNKPGVPSATPTPRPIGLPREPAQEKVVEATPGGPKTESLGTGPAVNPADSTVGAPVAPKPAVTGTDPATAAKPAATGTDQQGNKTVLGQPSTAKPGAQYPKPSPQTPSEK